MQRKLLSTSNLDHPRAARDSARAARDAARARYELLQQGRGPSRWPKPARQSNARPPRWRSRTRRLTPHRDCATCRPRRGLAVQTRGTPARRAARRDPARGRHAVRANHAPEPLRATFMAGTPRRGGRRRSRGAYQADRALRRGGGSVHAVLRPDAEGPFAACVHRRNNARRSAARAPAGMPVQVFVPACSREPPPPTRSASRATRFVPVA